MSDTEYRFRFIDVPRAIWFFLHKERPSYVFFNILLFIVLSLDLVPPYIIGLVVDFLQVFKASQSLNYLYFLIGLLIISAGVISTLRLSAKRVLANASISARYRAKVWGFERLLDFSLVWHEQENTGNKAQRIITGSEAIREWTSEAMNIIFPAVSSFVGTLAACLILTPYFVFFFLYYIIFLVGIELFYDRKISKLSDQINKSMENASGAFVESASNILAIKALGAGKNMTSNVEAREETSRSLSHKRVKFGITKWIFLQIHNSIAWGLFILIIAFLVIYSGLKIGLVLTYIYYFNNLRVRATEFTAQFQTMIERKSNLGRMMPFFWTENALTKGDKDFPADWKTITLRDARFAYKTESVLHNINLSIKRHEKIGIAGYSGSGKSTLIKLFLGLYHLEKGDFLINDTKIEDIRHEELMSHVSVVLQETELFNFSLRENVTMMRQEEPELFRTATHIACLDDLIRRLPAGIDTLIGERGYSLSGGERQRVGIARAIYKNAPLLLIDEATSALDSKTEGVFMERLMGTYAADKTMLIVAHRVSTLKDTDRIIVFDRGVLAESGSFRELSQNPAGLFGSMFAKQSVSE